MLAFWINEIKKNGLSAANINIRFSEAINYWLHCFQTIHNNLSSDLPVGAAAVDSGCSEQLLMVPQTTELSSIECVPSKNRVLPSRNCVQMMKILNVQQRKQTTSTVVFYAIFLSWLLSSFLNESQSNKRQNTRNTIFLCRKNRFHEVQKLSCHQWHSNTTLSSTQWIGPYFHCKWI